MNRRQYDGLPISTTLISADYPRETGEGGEELASSRIKSDSWEIEVRGACMAPFFHNKNVLFIRLQSSADPGQKVVALLLDDPPTCNVFRDGPLGPHLELTNGKYPQINAPDFTILGVVVLIHAESMMRISPIVALLFLPYAAVFAQEPVTQAAAVLHPENLNDAFKISQGDMERAAQKGQELAKKGKGFAEVYKDNIEQPRGVKGEKGKSHESSVMCYTLNGLIFKRDAYKAARNYDPAPKLPIGDQFAHSVGFGVNLVSVPKVGASAFSKDRIADEDDVRVTKFVLTDDTGDILNVLDATSPTGVKTGQMGFSGVSALPHTDTSQTNSTANVNAYGSDGSSVNAYGAGASSTTRAWTEYVPWSVSHPYFMAKYLVSFPVFGPDGQPLIKRGAKSMTLHIITPNGEKQVTYGLHPPKI